MKVRTLFGQSWFTLWFGLGLPALLIGALALREKPRVRAAMLQGIPIVPIEDRALSHAAGQ